MDWRVFAFCSLMILMSCDDNNSLQSLNPLPDISPSRPSDPPSSPSVCPTQGLPSGIVRDQDFLSFPNFGFRGIGRCRGHALVSQRLLYFMRFNPHAPKDWDCDYDRAECQEKFRLILSKVESNQVVVVNGYENLNELSQELALRAILRGEILQISHRYSAVPIKLSAGLARQVALFKELKKRVRLNHLTYVALKGEEVGQHGVLVYKLNGRNQICVRDPNIVPEYGEENCQNYFTLRDEKIYYHRHARGESLVLAEVFSDEEVRLNSFRQSLCEARRLGYL